MPGIGCQECITQTVWIATNKQLNITYETGDRIPASSAASADDTIIPTPLYVDSLPHLPRHTFLVDVSHLYMELGHCPLMTLRCLRAKHNCQHPKAKTA